MNHPDSTDSAAARLRQLNQYFREHPVTGPLEGHSPQAAAPAPLSLATLDHVTASINEVIKHTRSANPSAGRAPTRADAIYDWARQHTEHAPEAVQQRTAAIEYRQYLEHAIRAGDWRKVIRPQRCPECRTFGLMWQADTQRALCTNTRCVDRDGFSTTVTLARLAHQHVTAQKKLRQSRAT
ncbi:hypothetical protein DMH12_36175 [Streptomyces sp. WAC 04229]|uniref:hypothetical protein n=1 Tax=Streptomyces sp. WAC 04229 TaxID=2203206 RepID=UPI000F742FBA|nr:hypothetical protein [Streptomyces sp. WAC 04229]RSN39994.1 hypothetical protein DMH12_36175 [Streptomyces sp. WAC 04229]